MADTLLTKAKALEAAAKDTFAGVDVAELDTPVRKLVQDFKRGMTDIRLDVRDFEFADTLADQRRSGQIANRRLEKVRKQVLALSDQGLVSAADVAEYSARIEDLTKELQNE